MPVQNNCTPANVYGPINHWLFLGCSVMSFSASVGWNGQEGSLTVQLVEDNCTAPAEHPKHYMDSLLTEQTTTAVDPGFYGLSYDIIGTPVYFRVDEFEFAGLVQSWEEQKSESGNPTYTVKIVDPRQILEGTQLIINEYAGSVGSNYNLINVFGYMESFGLLCPQYYQSAPGVYSPGDGSVDGAVFGTPAGAYGGAKTNENGMQWNRIVTGLNILVSSMIPASNQFSPYGRLIYRGVSTVLGQGILYSDSSSAQYLLDISEVPVMPSYWRLNGSNVGLMDALNQVLEAAGFDYYIELVPVYMGLLKGWGGTAIANVIKVRTVDRGTQPDLTQINTFIDAQDNVISNSRGRESRNELTASFVIGGPKQTIYQAEQSDNPDGEDDDEIVGIEVELLNGEVVGNRRVDAGCDEIDDMILPYFGLDENGDIIVPCKDANGFWEFEAETWGINESLQVLQLPVGTVTINELELIFAMGGYDSWMSYVTAQRQAGNAPDTASAIPANLVGDFRAQENILQAIIDQIEKFLGRDLVQPVAGAFHLLPNAGAKINEDVRAIHDWVNKFARDFYGKKFMVRVPFTCVKWDVEAEKAFTSETPAQDGWTEVTPIIGLPNNSAVIDFFRNDTNKIEAFVRIDDAAKKETRSLDPNDYGIYNNDLYIKAQVEGEFVYHDADKFFAPRVIVTLPQAINQLEDDDVAGKGFKGVVNLLKKVHGVPVAAAEAILKRLEGKVAFAPFEYLANMIDAACFGMVSNIMTYGPWTNVGVPGQIRVEHQEGLVPWEYGGYATMNLAGQSIADEGVTSMQQGEMGNIQVPGYPTLPLGSELGAVGGGFFGGNHLVENRSLSDSAINDNLAGGIPFINKYGYFAYSGTWTGVYGPNITSVDTNVGPGGVTTTYTFRTYTPKIGRFARSNAERLKQVGQNRIRNARKLRAFILERVKRQALLLQLDDRRNQLQNNIGNRNQTPHSVFGGQLIPWITGSGFRRTPVITMPMTEVANEMQHEYSEKAFMSMDGLLRPISMDGDGGLPRYAQKSLGCYQSGPELSMPPVNNGTCDSLGTEYYNDAIDIDYLNPFSNPQGKSRSAIPTNRTDTPKVGHDMDLLGRDGTGSGDTPISGMIMPIAGYGDSDGEWSDYTDDYRMLALRGPLIMQSWSYDTNGRPIPNKADTEGNAEVGIFTDSNLECKFMDGFLRKPHTWPVGPIDLRWDRKRACWVAPTKHKILEATLCEEICPQGSGKATISESQSLYDCDGSAITPAVMAYDRVGNCYNSGEKVLLDYDTTKCQHFIIERKSNKVFAFELTECMPLDGPGSGIRLDNNGTPTGAQMEFYTRWNCEWGPSPAGYRGWAVQECDEDGQGNECFKNYIIYMEEPATYIQFTTTSEFGSATYCNSVSTADASISYYWEGCQPQVPIVVRLPDAYTNPECFPIGTKGVAIWDDRGSDACTTGCDVLVYNIVEVNTMLKVWSTTCGDDTPTDGTEIKHLVVGTGLAMEDEDSLVCAKKIYLDLLLSPASGTCVSDYNLPLEGVRFSSIGLGKGLNANYDSATCAITLGAGITATGTDECIEDGELTEGKLYNSIAFGQGISVAEDGACGLKIGADANMAVATGTGCVSQGNVTSGTTVGTLIFKNGININILGEGAGCSGATAEIGLGLTIGGAQVSSIELGECLTVTGTGSGECTATLDFANKITPTAVEFVIDVECSGTGTGALIVITTNFMHFNGCGQFIGVSESGTL